MLKSKLIFFVVLVLALSGSSYAQDAAEISKKAMEAIEMGDMEMDATLLIIDAKGRERVRQVITQTLEMDDQTRTLLRFTAPADVKGTALLIYDYAEKADDMWIYLPALKRTRRIVSNEKGKSFMGSEFSNADMSVPSQEDFMYQILGEEVVDGKTCWKVESKCKNEDIEDQNGYLRRVSWIDKELYLCYKVEFYDFDNELYKQQTIQDYKSQPGDKYFAFKMEMLNVKKGRKSIMKVNSLSALSSKNEAEFAPNRLSK